jgi:hypothetical protein
MGFHIKKVFLFVLVVVLSVSCQNRDSMEKPEARQHSVDFSNISTYAVLAKDAYASEGEIQKKYPEALLKFRSVPQSQVQYFILEEKVNKELLIAIRGTANRVNALKDAEYAKRQDKKLELLFHRGFKRPLMSCIKIFSRFFCPSKPPTL